MSCRRRRCRRRGRPLPRYRRHVRECEARTTSAARKFRVSPGGAPDAVGPVLVDHGEALTGARVRQEYVTCAFESADGVAHAVVEIIVKPHAGRWNFLQERGLDVPMVIEAFR